MPLLNVESTQHTHTNLGKTKPYLLRLIWTLSRDKTKNASHTKNLSPIAAIPQLSRHPTRGFFQIACKRHRQVKVQSQNANCHPQIQPIPAPPPGKTAVWLQNRKKKAKRRDDKRVHLPSSTTWPATRLKRRKKGD